MGKGINMPYLPRLAWIVLAVSCLASVPASASRSVYKIKPEHTTIAFSVDHLGLFTTEGSFAQFDGNLLLDLNNPENSLVDVNVNTASVQVNSAEAKSMLLSADYFDPAKYPQLRFKATSVAKLDQGKVRITGDLTVRDITRPQVLEAQLTDRRFDPALGAEVAKFVVKGTMERSAFGMNSDEDFVSDDVTLTISAFIQLQPQDATTAADD